MATEVGRLSAVFDLDARPFDRGLRGVETKIIGITGVMKSLGSASVALQGPLGGVAGRLQGLSALSSQAATGMGALGVGFSVVGAAAVGLSVALFNLVKNSAKVGGELFDLSQKTAFTVETLSGLSIVARTTGSDINGLAPSLVIFQKNMEAAGDATSKQGRLFRSLSIDTRDNEKALRQAFTALAKMGEGSHQTAVAMQLFGRSGKDVLAIIKETNGNLDVAIRKYAEMGLIISTGAATASDKFNDLLEETTLQLEAVTRSIGMELLPVAIDALHSISAGLRANKDEWASWGTSIANIMRGLSAAVHSELGQMLGRITEFSMKWLNLTGLILQGLGALGSSTDKPSEDFFGPGGAGRGGRKTLPGTPEFLAAQRRLAGTQSAGLGGGGGRRGGGGGPKTDPLAEMKQLADLQVRIVLEGLKREEEDIQRSYDQRRTVVATYQRAISRLEENHHQTVLDALKAEENATKSSRTLTNTQKKIALQEIELKRLEEANRHRREEHKLEDAILSVSRERIVTAEKTLDYATRERIVLVETLRTLTAMRERVVGGDILKDLGGGSAVFRGEATRPRIATVDEQVMRDQLARIREQMRQLGNELTGIFGQSISDGFNNGIKSGLQTLAQGLLRIVEDIFLRKMAQGLGDLLSGIAGGNGGGGNWFTKYVLPIAGAALGAGLGTINLGGGSTYTPGGTGLTRPRTVGRASGGPVSPGSDYLVGEAGMELFRPSVPGTIIPNNKLGQQTVVNNHYHMHVAIPDRVANSWNPKRSGKQVAADILTAIQGAQA